MVLELDIVEIIVEGNEIELVSPFDAATEAERREEA